MKLLLLLLFLLISIHQTYRTHTPKQQISLLQISQSKQTTSVSSKAPVDQSKNDKNTKTNSSKATQKPIKHQKQQPFIQCDLELAQGNICYSSGEIISSSPRVDSLQAVWSFDRKGCFDNSGKANHVKQGCDKFDIGPGALSFGHSVKVAEGGFLKVDHSEGFKSQPFSISFWVFKLNNGENGDLEYCPLIQKGLDKAPPSSEKTIFQRSPGIFLKKDRSLGAFLSTKKTQKGESVESHGKLTHPRWVHISIVRATDTLRLYFNGILDSVGSIAGISTPNTSPLFIGNSPLYLEKCKNQFYIDEIKWFSKKLQQDYIQAEASVALGGIEPSYLQVGCFECKLQDAKKSCIDGFHLCTSIQIHSGVEMAAIANGWIYNMQQKLWTHAATLGNGGAPLTKQGKPQLGLGLCCRNYSFSGN